ncbi:ATP synthase F1 subcomplex delta subunit [Marinobacter daqiaonensis]|uniref:ATP synthase subunit delta n=1 Tax=Marinobacter daqiaonensis TaxID=650891 RepID=A0A1I6IED4_9GAMM|nr:F0F1 ATP synthase subunit delta [Marinobacter daqiaonensis]SFR65137.1 ATP synthase F1 subcomplex delta subunit [Marinobacter daqiaonensis]
MAELITLARPYARAAFETAQSQDALAEWSDVLTTTGRVAANSDVKGLLAHPGVDRSVKAEIILEFAGTEVSERVRNFFAILAETGRLTLLPEISELFRKFRAELERTVEIDVTAAFELSEEQQQKLAQALSRNLDRQVSLSTQADSSLIGGVVIRTGDMVIDASVRGKLQKLADTLGA